MEKCRALTPGGTLKLIGDSLMKWLHFCFAAGGLTVELKFYGEHSGKIRLVRRRLRASKEKFNHAGNAAGIHPANAGAVGREGSPESAGCHGSEAGAAHSAR